MKKVSEGFFVVFEGCDGSGKTSVSQQVWRMLQSAGYSSLWTREPGGTPVGQALRELLVRTDSIVTERTELLLYAADRAQHIASKIIPALEEGSIVISDRYYHSTMAFQGAGRGHDSGMLLELQDMAGTFDPDLTIILDVHPDVAERRNTRVCDVCHVKASEQKFENIAKADPSFGDRVRKYYASINRPYFRGRVKGRTVEYIHLDNSEDNGFNEVSIKAFNLIIDRILKYVSP